MDKCIFTTRFKECYKEKGYTQEKLAEKLNISVNGLKNYLRKKNDKLPPLYLLKHMAELLDVDTAYLLGEIDCKKYSQQTIKDVTVLDENMSSLLRNSNVAHSLNIISQSKHFGLLCGLIYEYSRNLIDDQYRKIIEIHPFDFNWISRKNRVEYKTTTLDNCSDFFNAAYATKKILKNRILDIFDEILDEIVFIRDGGNEKIGCIMSCRLLGMIKEKRRTFSAYREECSLKDEIRKELIEIERINSSEYITRFTPYQIIWSEFDKLEQFYKKEYDRLFNVCSSP